MVKLKVSEALTTDVGRGIVRLDSRTRREMNVTSGDIVVIKGKRETGAIVWQAYNTDEGEEIIRMDGVIRQNAGVSVGDSIEVVKAKNIKEAKKVVFAPTQELRFTGEFADYMKRNLQGRPISKGDTTVMAVFNQPLMFKSVSVSPKGVVQITHQTKIEIREQPVKEGEGLPQVSYEDIGGLDEEIRKVKEIIELPLKHPELFHKLGIYPPKGVLLYGPPGTGKTLLAKAVASESEANFISIQGPEIISKFVGEAEERLRDIFKKAEENAPTIIFLDEIDAIAPKRGEVTGEVEKRVVAQLLAAMDGLEGRGKVIVIGATNRENALDPALRRPGRFDREIEIGVPDKKGRKKILQIHTRGMPISMDDEGKKDDEKYKDKLLDIFAAKTHGYVGADLAALAREAAMKTLRRKVIPNLKETEDGEGILPVGILESLKVTKEDFEGAFREVQPSAMREVLIEIPNIKWDDIGGLEKAKKELKEAIEWPLKYPEVFERMGIKPPRGIFIYGPPGTGKTLLGKAVANESESNFISIKGPELLSKWVGESEKGVREIFRKARQAAPCIIFLDEIDAMGSIRGAHSGSHVTESVVNQLLTEMDGLEELKGVVVIAATNRPDMVDPALLRPGRFDRHVVIPIPDEKTRLEILKVHTKKMPLAKDVDIEKLSRETGNYSGADIEAIVREAAYSALRKNMKVKEVTMKDFEAAMKQVRPSFSPKTEDKYEDFKDNYKGAEYL